MKKLAGLIRRIPPYARTPILVTLVTQLMCYYSPMIFGVSPTHVLSSALDESIPVIPAFIYIYVAAFFFWIANYCYIYCFSADFARRLLTADLMCKIVCALCFVLYPCTLVQPDPESLHGIGAWLLKLIYHLDQPTNLLPSMHCYISVLIALPLMWKKDTRTPLWYRVFSVALALAICLSTLFTKQHVVADVYTGALMAVAAWLISRAVWGFIDRRSGAKKQTNA